MQAEDAIHSLRESLTKGLTGCLSNHDGDPFRVFLMQGDILAAHGPDDGIWIVRRLVNNGAITEGQGRQVIFYLGQGYRLEELLLDQVPDQLFLDLLGERFRQNLLDFSFLTGPLRFEQMDAIFVDNIQVGHDSLALLEEVESLRDRIAPLRRRADTARLRPGASRPRSRQEARLLDLCQGNTRLEDLLVTSPYEEGPTLDLIQRMLANGALEDPTPPPAPTIEPAPEPIAPPMMRDDESYDSSVTPHSQTVEDDIWGPATPTPAPPAPVAPEPAPAPAALAPEPAPAPTPAPASEPDYHDDYSDLAPKKVPEPAPSFAEEEEEEEDPFFSISTDGPGHNPLGYDDDEFEDAGIGLFSDNDYLRGGGQGQFTVSKDLLDRVDLSTPSVESKTPPDKALDEMIELGDAENLDDSERASAHSMSFGPPPIEVMEQRRKVSVCNEVLVELTNALDTYRGPGTGRAFIQLLVDGTPHQYAILFMNVDIDSAGRVDVDQVVRNLAKRPPSERRRVLNLGSIDLINRALSAGSEELDDDSMDLLLEQIAGYQMRIGL